MPFSSSTYLITMRIYIDYTLQTCQNPAQSTCRPAAPKHLLFLQSSRMASLRRLAREIKKQQVSMTIEFDCSLNNSSTAFLTFFFKNQAIELKRPCPRLLGVQCARAVLAWCSPTPCIDIVPSLSFSWTPKVSFFLKQVIANSSSSLVAVGGRMYVDGSVGHVPLPYLPVNLSTGNN